MVSFFRGEDLGFLVVILRTASKHQPLCNQVYFTRDPETENMVLPLQWLKFYVAPKRRTTCIGFDARELICDKCSASVFNRQSIWKKGDFTLMFPLPRNGSEQYCA